MLNKFKDYPIATYLIIAICCLCFILPYSIQKLFSFNPVYAYYEPYRFISSNFIHANLTHIAFNMVALYSIGTQIEKFFGTFKFLVIYFVATIGGSLVILLWVFADPSSFKVFTVGASGAIFGLFGAIFIIQKSLKMNTGSMLGVLMLNLSLPFFIDNISWQAHVGGLITGSLTCYALLKKPNNIKDTTYTTIVAATALVALVLLIILVYQIMIAMLD